MALNTRRELERRRRFWEDKAKNAQRQLQLERALNKKNLAVERDLRWKIEELEADALEQLQDRAEVVGGLQKELKRLKRE